MIENWLLKYIPSSGELAVDVGANKGDWVSELRSRFKKVVAIEPDERISSNILRRSNIELIKGVIGDIDGEVDIFLRPHAGHNSLLSEHPIEDPSRVPIVGVLKVRSFKLDTLFPNGADFVKIDTEGFEVNVLRGCQNSWDRTTFIVECHNNYDGVVIELLRLGKSIEKIKHPHPNAHIGHCWIIAK